MDTLNAKTGVPFAIADFTPLVILDGLTLTNVGAGPRTTGRLAVIFYNSDVAVDLVVTPAVTAKLSESGVDLDAIPVAITIPAEEFAIIGPFGLEHEGTNHALNFTFTGQGGSYYAFYVR